MKSFSTGTKLLVLAAFVILAAAVVSLQRMIAVLPLIALPTALFIWYELKQQPNARADKETSVQVYILTGTIGMVCVGGGQALLAFGAALIFFQSRAMEYVEEFQVQEDDFISVEHRARRKEMIHCWQYWAFLFCLCFVSIAFLEEGLKYLATRLAVRRARSVSLRHYSSYAILSSLGFSTVENFGFIYAAIQHEPPLRFVITIFTRIFACTIIHALGALLIAEEMMRQRESKEITNIRAVLAIPVLFHGTFDFVLLGVSAANGNVGWIMPKGILPRTLIGVFGSSMLLALTMILIQKRKWRQGESLNMGNSPGASDVQIPLVNSEDAQ